MSDLIHFALSYRTACNKYIVGGTIDWQEDAIAVTSGEHVQHTCIIDDVTCDKCRESAIYLKTLDDDYISEDILDGNMRKHGN